MKMTNQTYKMHFVFDDKDNFAIPDKDTYNNEFNWMKRKFGNVKYLRSVYEFTKLVHQMNHKNKALQKYVDLVDQVFVDVMNSNRFYTKDYLSKTEWRERERFLLHACELLSQINSMAFIEMDMEDRKDLGEILVLSHSIESMIKKTYRATAWKDKDNKHDK